MSYCTFKVTIALDLTHFEEADFCPIFLPPYLFFYPTGRQKLYELMWTKFSGKLAGLNSVI